MFETTHDKARFKITVAWNVNTEKDLCSVEIFGYDFKEITHGMILEIQLDASGKIYRRIPLFSVLFYDVEDIYGKN